MDTLDLNAYVLCLFNATAAATIPTPQTVGSVVIVYEPAPHPNLLALGGSEAQRTRPQGGAHGLRALRAREPQKTKPDPFGLVPNGSTVEC